MFIATFIASRTGENLIQLNGRMYRKTLGRAYRSYWQCIEIRCDAEIMVNDLKGGFLKIIKDHRPHCQHEKDKKKKSTNL